MQNKLCVILVLDQASNKRLNDDLRLLDAYDINVDSVHGHITIATFLDVNITELVNYTSSFFLSVIPFQITCDYIKRLTGTNVSCFPKESETLQSLYKAFHQKYDQYCDDYTKLSMGHWTPHITMYNQSEADSVQVEAVLSKGFAPFTATVVGVELSLVHEDTFEIVYHHDLYQRD